MKIGLIAAKGKDERSYGTPLGLGSIKAYIEQKLPVEVRIFEDEKEMIAYKPDLVGISSVTSCYGYAIKMGQLFKKELNTPVVIGGYHISSLPESLHETFDLGIIGEGELTLEELICEFSKTKNFSLVQLNRIEGIVYREAVSRSIIINSPRKLIKNLDELPMPYREINPCNPEEAAIITSRGCPYNCIFCSSALHWQSKFRTYSAERVVAEIENIVNQYTEVKQIYILDDLFMADRKRLSKMVELIEERGINKRVSFRGFARANLVDDEVCMLFNRMNFTELRFGAETGSERLLQYLKGKNVSVKDNQRVVDLCKKYNIKCYASIMVGVPGETEEDLMYTHKFLKNNAGNVEVSGFYVFQPFPGTEIYHGLAERGHHFNTDWNGYNLSFYNDDFHFNTMNYYNEKNISRERFKMILLFYFSDYLPESVFKAEEENHLEIGCGPSPRKGFSHADVRPLPHVEYVCNATNLEPIADNHFMLVFSRHMLEHLDEFEGVLALLEMKRVLKDEGLLYICVPDILYHIKEFQDDSEGAFGGLWGWQTNPYDIHKWGYSFESLSRILAVCGFDHVTDVSKGLFSREYSEKHLEVFAQKSTNSPNNHKLSSRQTNKFLRRLLMMSSKGEITDERLKSIFNELRPSLSDSPLALLFNSSLNNDSQFENNIDISYSDLMELTHTIPKRLVSGITGLINSYRSKNGFDVSFEYNIGSFYERHGMYDLALMQFTNIEKQPLPKTNEQIYGIQYHMGYIYYMLEDFDKARFHLDQCLESEPNHRKAKEILDLIQNKG